MKKINSFLTCIMLILACLTSCNQTNIPGTDIEPLEKLPDKIVFENDLYKLERIDGQNYIIVKDKESLQKELWGFQLGYLEFYSMLQLKQKVTVGGLDKDELAKIFLAFPKDSQERIKVCEFEKLYTPAIPENMHIGKIYWSGERYGYDILQSTEYGASDENIVRGYIDFLTKEQYSKEIDSFGENLQKNFSAKTKDELRDTEIYTYNNSTKKNVVYSFLSNDVFYTVLEEYNTDSDELPHTINLYCQCKDIFFTVKLYGMNVRPDRYWLAKIGMESFKE